MDSKAQPVNNEEKNLLAPKRLWVAPILTVLDDQNNINGTIGPGSDFGQAPPGTPS